MSGYFEAPSIFRLLASAAEGRWGVKTVPNIPRIQIEQQNARIGIISTPARVEVIDRPRPKMHIISERPRMEIEHKAPAFTVQAQRKPAERPALSRYRRYLASLPQAPQRHNASRTAADTAAPATAEQPPESGGPSVSPRSLELTKALNDYAAALHTENLTQYMPDIEWDAGYINITWSSAQMHIEWEQEDHLPRFAVEPHSVEIYLREKPYIKITVSDEVIAAMYGSHMDKKV